MRDEQRLARQKSEMINRSRQFTEQAIKTADKIYDYEQRYQGAHRSNRNAAIETVSLTKYVGLCPFCLRPTYKGLFAPGTLRRHGKRHMEGHHVLGYGRLKGIELPACVMCHQNGWAGDSRKSVLHHPSAWRVDRQNPDNSRNTLPAIVSFVLQWWVAIVIAWCIRQTLKPIRFLTGKRG